MAGNQAGGLKTKQAMLAQDQAYYQKIGRLGGQARVPKGFARMSKAAISAAGRKGGTKSRRTKP